MIAQAYILHDTAVRASVKSTDEMVRQAKELIRKDNERAERQRSLLTKKPEEANSKFVLPAKKLCAAPKSADELHAARAMGASDAAALKLKATPPKLLGRPPTPATSALTPEEKHAARQLGISDAQAFAARDIGSPAKLGLSEDEQRVARAMGASDAEALKARRR